MPMKRTEQNIALEPERHKTSDQVCEPATSSIIEVMEGSPAYISHTTEGELN